MHKLTTEELNLHIMAGWPVPVLDESYTGLVVDLHLSDEEQLLATELKQKRLLKPLRYVYLYIMYNDIPLFLCKDGRNRSISNINALRERLQLSLLDPDTYVNKTVKETA